MGALVIDAHHEPTRDGAIKMTSDIIGGSHGMFGRFCLPKLAKPRSPRAGFCKRQRSRIAFGVALLAFLCCAAAQGSAAENLECPEIGPGRFRNSCENTHRRRVA